MADRLDAIRGTLGVSSEVMVNGPDDVYVERKGPLARVESA
jgi:hypothetical protein